MKTRDQKLKTIRQGLNVTTILFLTTTIGLLSCHLLKEDEGYGLLLLTTLSFGLTLFFYVLVVGINLMIND